MGNVIQLNNYRSEETQRIEILTYHAKLLSFSKVELLEEMVRFQEERKAAGELSPSMMERGVILFRLLEKAADSQEMRILSRSYSRHLEYEIKALRENAGGLK